MNDVVRRMTSLALTSSTRHQGVLSRALCIPSGRFLGQPSTPPRLLSTSVASAYRQPLGSSHDITIGKAAPLGGLWMSRSHFSSQAVSQEEVSLTIPKIVTDDSGNQYGQLLDNRRLPKLKPGVVNRRLAKMKTYVGNEKAIRHSPWKLNRVCQLAAGLPLEDALTQLQFLDKKNADLLSKILTRTSNLADIRDGLQISQLEVAECFTTKAMNLKRIKPMGRGRHGVMHHKFSHIRVLLREIDFKLKIYQAPSMNQKKKWLAHQMRAQREFERAQAERQEMKRLEKQQEEQARARKSGDKS